jgi:hypothetical protein
VDTVSDLCVFPRKLVPGPKVRQLRSLRSQRYTHTDLWMAHPHTQPRSSAGFHLAFRGGRRPTPNHRGRLASQLQPLSRLPQQPNPGRDHLFVSASPDGIHTVSKCKDHWEHHTSGRPLHRVPRSHTALGNPAGGTPQYSPPHHNYTRSTGILSTPSPCT